MPPGFPTSRRCRTTSPSSGRRPAVKSLIPAAEKHGVYLNMENIFANGFLHSPQEMNAVRRQLRQRAGAGPLRHRQHHAVPVPRALDSDARQADQEHPPQGIQQESPRVQPQRLPPAARRHHQLARRARSPRRDRLPRLPDVRVLPPLPALPEAIVYHTRDALDRMLGRKA